MTDTPKFKRIQLQPDTQAAERLSRILWQKSGGASRGVKNTAGSRVYRHASEVRSK